MMMKIITIEEVEEAAEELEEVEEEVEEVEAEATKTKEVLEDKITTIKVFDKMKVEVKATKGEVEASKEEEEETTMKTLTISPISSKT